MYSELQHCTKFENAWLGGEYDIYFHVPTDLKYKNDDIVLTRERPDGSYARQTYWYKQEDIDAQFKDLISEVPGYVTFEVTGPCEYRFSYTPIINLDHIAENEIGKSDWIPDGPIKKDAIRYMRLGIIQHARDRILLPMWFKWESRGMYGILIGIPV